jgi:hypothetical protein
MFTFGELPYEGASNQEVMDFVKGGGKLGKSTCNVEIFALLQGCWKFEPEERSTLLTLQKQLLM